ncbi:hypothetical protein EVAR_95659_1 [Eumeta japonica]|uniref:Uncharacterized protein n=1 Tax=Eumeta variegata TaxID=151549 RepID=A0A4C1VK30_EUMVA|nr:hypothetical protein EVAR_95659_1 [Eumeta japonica]
MNFLAAETRALWCPIRARVEFIKRNITLTASVRLRVRREEVATAAHGYSHPYRSRQCDADLFDRNRIFDRGEVGSDNARSVYYTDLEREGRGVIREEKAVEVKRELLRESVGPHAYRRVYVRKEPSKVFM